MSDEDAALEALRFPIGRFDLSIPDLADVERGIASIEAAPERLRAAVEGLDEEQLSTPYRPGGWTVRQVVHHVPDSHLNSLCRFKLALTEDAPAIRPYFEDRWANLADYGAPVELALDLVDALHKRWVALLRSLTPADLGRTFVHPEMNETIRLDTNVMIYAWHGEHHVAHITSLREREGW